MPATNGSRISRNSTTAAMTAASIAIQNISVRVRVMQAVRDPVLIESRDGIVADCRQFDHAGCCNIAFARLDTIAATAAARPLASATGAGSGGWGRQIGATGPARTKRAVQGCRSIADSAFFTLRLPKVFIQ